jgi:hypothetical protein
MSLFEFEQPTGVKDDRGAKIAIPSTGSTGIVNVVSDYRWTVNPKEGRKDVPYMEIIERKVTNDVLLQQLLYNITAAYTEGETIPKEIIAAVRKKITKSKAAAGDTTETTDRQIKKQADTQLKAAAGGDAESPYAGLYSLEDTGWSFILPYFDKQNHNISSNWTKPNASGLGAGLMKGVSDAVGEVATGVSRVYSMLGALGTGVEARVGTYIEQAKMYQFASGGASYSVQFDLYNTVDVEDVIKNWEICFLLMYNTLPNRRTKTTFDPPPLYEVTIPGVRRSPVSFIKSLKVEFVGATRLMDLDVAGQTRLRTIVPDAYSVTIDFEDVLPESKNFMNSMLDEDAKISVTLKEPEATSARGFSHDGSIGTEANDITYIPIANSGATRQQGQATTISDLGNEQISGAIKNVKDTGRKLVNRVSGSIKGVF